MYGQPFEWPELRIPRKSSAPSRLSLPLRPKIESASSRMRTLSPDEARRLLEAARGDRFDALYVLAITAGLRQGELLALCWRDVDLAGRTVRVTGSLQNLPGEGLTIVEPKTVGSRRNISIGATAPKLSGATVRPKPRKDCHSVTHGTTTISSSRTAAAGR